MKMPAFLQSPLTYMVAAMATICTIQGVKNHKENKAAAQARVGKEWTDARIIHHGRDTLSFKSTAYKVVKKENGDIVDSVMRKTGMDIIRQGDSTKVNTFVVIADAMGVERDSITKTTMRASPPKPCDCCPTTAAATAGPK